MIPEGWKEVCYLTVDMVVARIFEPEADHGVRSINNHLIVSIAVVCIPWVPAQGREFALSTC